MARKYTRDNRGRFASVGATARGGRLRTASGKKRETQTAKIKGGAASGTIGKPKGLKPGAIKAKPAAKSSAATPKAAARRDKLQSGPLAGAGDSIKQGLRGMGNRAINRVETATRLSELQKAGKLNRLTPSQSRRAQSVFNDAQRKVSAAPRIAAEQRLIQLAIKADKMRRSAADAPATKPAAKPAARRADRAEANIPMRGARGRRLDADISRAVRQVNAAETARLMKPRAQVRAERAARAAARQAAAAAKPKRTRSAESLRVSRAKQVEKRRGMNINNPAAWRQESAGRMAANAKRTQERALAFYNAAKKRRRSG